MSRKANPTVIGAFVVGAILIAVAAVMILTSGTLFQKKLDYVMYFEGSVKGLAVGAPVSYRGVQIGTVTNIEIVLSPKQDARIPVTVELDPGAFTLVGYNKSMSAEAFRAAVRRSCKQDGLRAQLQAQSLLTGQLFIQLDYFPDSPLRFVEAGRLPEIPTVPTTLQELGGILKDFPLKKVLDDARKAVAALADVAAADKIDAMIESVERAFSEADRLMQNLDARTRPLEPALTEARETLAEGRKALAQAGVTLAAAGQTFTQATDTMKPAQSLVGDDSVLLERIEDALAAITEAARAVGALADTLERQPEAILKGKGTSGGG
ncbi:MAG: MlaD family protein [Gammaproteobacteria bacterium]|jgi:paraquat-inducible protein B